MNHPSDVGDSPSEAAEVEESSNFNQNQPSSPAACIPPTTPMPLTGSQHADVAKLGFNLGMDLHKPGSSGHIQLLGYCLMVPAQDAGGLRKRLPDLNDEPPPESHNEEISAPDLIGKIKSRCFSQFSDDYVISFLAEHGSADESAEYKAMKSAIAQAQQVWKEDCIGISNMLFLSQKGKIEHALQLVDQALIEDLVQLEEFNVPTPQEQVESPPPNFKANHNDISAAVADQKLPDSVDVVEDEAMLDGDEARPGSQKRKAVDGNDLQIINKKAAHGGNLGSVACEAEAAVEN